MAFRVYIHLISNCRRDLFQSPYWTGVDPIQDKEFHFLEFAIVNNGGMLTQWQIRVAGLHTLNVSICPLPKFKLGLPYVKTSTIAAQHEDHTKSPAVGKVFRHKNVPIGKNWLFDCVHVSAVSSRTTHKCAFVFAMLLTKLTLKLAPNQSVSDRSGPSKGEHRGTRD